MAPPSCWRLLRDPLARTTDGSAAGAADRDGLRGRHVELANDDLAMLERSGCLRVRLADDARLDPLSGRAESAARTTLQPSFTFGKAAP